MSEEVIENGGAEVDEYEKKLKFINQIAHPLASKKLVKRLLKCVKKGIWNKNILTGLLIKTHNLASGHKNYVRQGLKEVQKHIRRGEKGSVLI